MSLDQVSPVARSVSKLPHPAKFLALSAAMLGLSLQSCEQAATRPVEESVAADEIPGTAPLARTVPAPAPTATPSILPPVDRLESQNIAKDGFKADSHVRWLWGGCTTFLVVNDKTKDILLIDAYVDKSTAGNAHNYPVKPPELQRVARYVNQIRSMVAAGYKISGILMTHGHGDHMGDLGLILQGIKSRKFSLFHGSGMVLIGDPYLNEINVYAHREATSFTHGVMLAGVPYPKNSIPKYQYTQLTSDGYIHGKGFKAGNAFEYGSFSITPYLWFHGNPDGKISLKRDVRTIAYSVTGKGYDNPATVFMTGSPVEETDHLNSLVGAKIPAHHVLFADGKKEITAWSASSIDLLENPPMGANYIIPTHNDNNSNVLDMNDNREDALGLYGRILKTGSIAFDKNRRTYWRTNPRDIRLGYFANRLGD